MTGAKHLFLFVIASGLVVGCAPARYSIDQPVHSLSSGENGLNIDPDALPPGSSGLRRFPAKATDFATLTFEDLFPKPGDADYNDLVMNFKIVENINSRGDIEKITIDFAPRARGAGYNHQFVMVLDGKKDLPSNLAFESQPLFKGDGEITLALLDGDDQVVEEKSNLSKDQDLVVFASTKDLFKDATGKAMPFANVRAGEKLLKPVRKARVTIVVKDPAQNPTDIRVAGVDISRYRMVLKVLDTKQDIDLVEVNRTNIDSNGNPFGFITPTDWAYPLESVNIKTVYTDYAAYMEWLLGSSTDPSLQPKPEAVGWYKRPAPDSAGRIFGASLFK